MTYATQQDMIDRFGEDELISLTDRNDVGVIDATVISRALEDAQDLIDVYLAKASYALPLTTVPRILKRISCDIARHSLYDEDSTEQVDERFKEALKTLKSIASRDVELNIDGAKPATETGDAAVFQGDDPVFTMNNMKGF